MSEITVSEVKVFVKSEINETAGDLSLLTKEDLILLGAEIAHWYIIGMRKPLPAICWDNLNRGEIT